ncbi:MAG: FkbM family methyltransferase [Pontiella sp.]
MKQMILKLLYKMPIPHGVVDFVRKRQFLQCKCDPVAVDFYRQFINPGDLVFDIGANMGNRSKIFLKLGAKVVAFEPQKRCAAFLRSVLGKEKDFTLIEAAVGAEEGESEMLVSDVHVLSTLSKNWVEAVKESGRFASNEWNEKQKVNVTTLDSALRKYGSPAFVKIDVEGYEYEVLSGLSDPVGSLSIELTPETIQTTFKCIEHMSRLSDAVFQYSSGETMEFDFPAWVTKTEILDFLTKGVDGGILSWGDLYMKKEK